VHIGGQIIDAITPEGVFLVVVAIALTVGSGFISLSVGTILVAAKALLVPLKAGVFVAFGLAGLKAGLAVSFLDVRLSVRKVTLRLVLPASDERWLRVFDWQDLDFLFNLVGCSRSASVGHPDRVASVVLLRLSVVGFHGAVVTRLLALDPGEADAFLVLGAVLEALFVGQIARHSAHQTASVVIATGVVDVVLNFAGISLGCCCCWSLSGCWCRGGWSLGGRSLRGWSHCYIGARHVVDALVPVAEVAGSALAVALVTSAVFSKFVAAEALVVPLQTGELVSFGLASFEASFSVADLEVGLSVRKITPFLVLVASHEFGLVRWGLFYRGFELLGFISIRERLLWVPAVDIFPAGEFAPEWDASVPAGFVQVVPPAVGFFSGNRCEFRALEKFFQLHVLVRGDVVLVEQILEPKLVVLLGEEVPDPRIESLLLEQEAQPEVSSPACGVEVSGVV